MKTVIYRALFCALLGFTGGVVAVFGFGAEPPWLPLNTALGATIGSLLASALLWWVARK